MASATSRRDFLQRKRPASAISRHRASSGAYPAARIESAASSSRGAQRDRSRSARRRAAPSSGDAHPAAALPTRRIRGKAAVPNENAQHALAPRTAARNQPASATASEVNSKRKSCGDQHPAAPLLAKPDSGRADISTVPQLDAAILQQVRDLGHYPQEFNDPKTQDEKYELKLCCRIRNKRKALHSDTLAELDAWEARHESGWPAMAPGLPCVRRVASGLDFAGCSSPELFRLPLTSLAVALAGRFLAAVVLTRCRTVLLLQAALLAARFFAALAAIVFASEALV